MHSHLGENMEECGAQAGDIIFQGSSVSVSNTCTQTQTKLQLIDTQASPFDNEALQWTQWQHHGVIMCTHIDSLWVEIKILLL